MIMSSTASAVLAVRLLIVLLLSNSSLYVLALSGDGDQEDGSAFPDDDPLVTTVLSSTLPISDNQTTSAQTSPLSPLTGSGDDTTTHLSPTTPITESTTAKTSSVTVGISTQGATTQGTLSTPMSRSTDARANATVSSTDESSTGTLFVTTETVPTTVDPVGKTTGSTISDSVTTTTELGTRELPTTEQVTFPPTINATTLTEEIDETTPPATTQAVTEETTSMITGRCAVPAYASINYEAMRSKLVTDDDLLVVEGRCYIACIEYVPAVGFERFLVRNEGYSTWPYNTIKGFNCNPHKYIHECTRGCVIANGNIPSNRACDAQCRSDCVDECGSDLQCNNPDSDEWWVRKTCRLTCRQQTCGYGCYNVTLECTNSDCSSPPSPVAFPTLMRVVDNERAGVYSINLTSSVPLSQAQFPLSYSVAFLFEIYDVATEKYSYRWKTDPQTLDLADFSCREVAVRFAVANKNGISRFSERRVILQVYGDTIKRPNPVTNIEVSQVDDRRMGFFGHVIWNISWNPPQNPLHLEGYTVSVFNPDINKPDCGLRVWEHTLTLNETASVRVTADEPGNLLVMNCLYNVQVHALGLEENETTTEPTYAAIFPSRPQFIHDLTCNKLWDPLEYKFSFNFTWSLPYYMAMDDPIEEYIVSVELVRAGSNVPERSIRTNARYTPPNKRPNETSFYYYMPHEGQPFFLPQANPELRFRFKLFFNFDENKVRFPVDSLSLPNRLFTCIMDTVSPPPTAVQNFTIISYEIIGTTKLSVKFSWIPPMNPNGLLRNYNVCVSQRPLGSIEEPLPHGGNSVCSEVNSILTETSMEKKFFADENSNCLYLQIRANNELVSGNWTDSAEIRLDQSKPCAAVVEDSGSEPLLPSAQPVSSMLRYGVPIIVTVIVLLCLIVLLAVCVCYHLRRRKREWIINQTPSNLDFMYNGGPRRHLLAETPTDTTQKLPGIDEWEIPPTGVIMEEKLGEGAFGEVYKGVVKGPLTCSKLSPSLRNAIGVPVAIKLLKESAVGSERKDFLSEIDMMKMISEGHNPNVIGMVGCVTLQEPLSLILEYVIYGDLLSYLRTNMRMNAGHDVGEDEDPYLNLGVIEPVDLVKFSYQIASGMEYLSCLGIVHRDLACRNILVDKGKVLKITDFGMSREIDEIYVQKSRGRVPLKWMALESILTREFTTASDVWSYGITLWEISTMGGFPYPSISNENLILLLKNGYRMEKPENCSPEIYAIMLSCWNGDPSKRPTFTEMKTKFDRMLQSNAEYIYFLPVNSDSPCYKPENAPEGLTVAAQPVQAFLSPNRSQNRISLCSYREASASELTPSHHSVHSGNHSGGNSGHSSPGRRSPRSVSPAIDLTSAANHLASIQHSRDGSHSGRGRPRNLYVQDPAQTLQDITMQARPTSMLISGQSATVSCGTGNQTDQAPRCRPSSVTMPHSSDGGGTSNGGVPRYINVTRRGSANENGGVVVVNPLFGLMDEGGRDREHGTELPGIKITDSDD